MEELEEKSNKGLEKFAAEGGDLEKVLSTLDAGIDNLIDNHTEASGTSYDTKSKSLNIRNLLIILLGVILIGFLGYTLWKKTHQEVRPEVFYAQYFEVLPSPNTGVVRSESTDTAASEGFIAYGAKNYSRAAMLLSQENKNPEALVYSGIAYLQADQPQKAVNVLELARSTPGITVYEDIRQWYMALALLKLDDKEACIDILETIVNTNHYKKNQAKELLGLLT